MGEDAVKFLGEEPNIVPQDLVALKEGKKLLVMPAKQGAVVEQGWMRGN